MMRLLVTGAGGFLGGCIVNHFGKKGNVIFAASTHRNMAIESMPTVHPVQVDWNNIESTFKFCKHVDVVIHCAGVNALDSQRNPTLAHRFNVMGTQRLIDAAVKNGVVKFIYLSTAHVYGSSLSGRVVETSETNPQHPYAQTKLAGERIIKQANSSEDLIGIIIRLSNVFGVPSHLGVPCWSLVINELCRQATEKRKLVLRTSGIQHRNFLNMRNFLSSVDLLCAASKDEVNDGIFNIGGSASDSVRNVATLIRDRCNVVLGYRPSLVCTSVEVNDLANEFEFDISKITKLGFSPSESNVDAIDDLLEFCANNFPQD